MNTTLLFLIIRAITLVFSGALAFMQGKILYQKWGNHNGMKKYRLLLFLFTLAFFVDGAIISYADFLLYFYNVGHGQTMDYLVSVRLISRIIEMTAIGYFYKLIYSAKNNEH